MFDGSHRSRRTIDLSGARRNRRRQEQRSNNTITATLTRPSAVTGLQDQRSQALEEARLERLKRKELQRQNAAARHLQSRYRGWYTRRRVAHELGRVAMTEENNNMLLKTTSMRLSVPLRPFLSMSIKQVLMEYQKSFSKKEAPSTDSTTLFSRRRILSAALQELRPPSLELLELVTGLLQTTPQTTLGYVELIMACQEWLLYNKSQETTRTLWDWCCRTAVVDPSLRLPLVAALVFCNDLSQEENSALLESLNQLQSNQNEHPHNMLLSRLMEALTASDTGDSVVHQAVSRLVKGRECMLLTNALKILNNSNKSTIPQVLAMCKFVQLVLYRRPDLAVLTSLAVRGDNIRDLVMGGNQGDATAAEDRMEITSEEDDDMEEEEEGQQAASAKRQRSSQYTRKDLQTVPKLDRLYQDNMSKFRKQVLLQIESALDKSQLVELALQLASPDLWLEWGNAVFDVNTDKSSDEARQSFVMLLFTLLQFTTGLRTRTQSTFLSQLAFHRGLKLLGGLWQCVVESMSVDTSDELFVTAAMTVFCDLFAHHLLVLHDEEFLRYYTDGDESYRNKVILAQDVITRLGEVLYQVYWSKPVVAADLSMLEEPAVTAEGALKRHCARLLLSGTKLWNSLYERWCRLYRHSTFCNESAWWFPRLMSKDADEVVNMNMAGDDDDDSVESMDVEEEQDDNRAAPPTEAEQESNALAETFRDPKMARILTCIPQALPFERRVKLFSSLLAADKQKTQDDEAEFQRAMMRMARRGEDMDDDMDFGGRVRVEIRRDVLYDDSMSKLNNLGPKLKKKVQVTFINQHGAHEAGIDGGGVFKEFLDDLIKEAFDPSDVHHQQTGAPQLFSVTPMQTLAVNSAASYDLSHYEFLGRVLGKAVYESILVEPQFCLPFLNQLLGKQNTLDDFKNFDAEYYKNLIKLRNMDTKDIDGLGLTFELTTSSGPGSETRTRELIHGGGSIAVTKQNVIQYVHLVAHQRLNVDGAVQTRAFLKGFRDLIPASWVRLFNSNELQKLISGDDTVRGIDVRGMKASMRYSAGYHPSQPIIVWFWEVVDEMTPEQQRKFLKFMTSCSRQPLLGFQALEPLPCVQQLRLPDDLFLHNDLNSLSKVTPLPTSSTCMNLLKLPNYRSKELLKKKLLDAVESGAGFELT